MKTTEQKRKCKYEGTWQLSNGTRPIDFYPYTGNNKKTLLKRLKDIAYGNTPSDSQVTAHVSVRRADNGMAVAGATMHEFSSVWRNWTEDDIKEANRDA